MDPLGIVAAVVKVNVRVPVVVARPGTRFMPLSCWRSASCHNFVITFSSAAGSVPP